MPEIFFFRKSWTIIEVFSALYWPNMDSEENKDARIFVGNVSPDTEPELIEQRFKVRLMKYYMVHWDTRCDTYVFAQDMYVLVLQSFIFNLFPESW